MGSSRRRDGTALHKPASPLPPTGLASPLLPSSPLSPRLSPPLPPRLSSPLPPRLSSSSPRLLSSPRHLPSPKAVRCATSTCDRYAATVAGLGYSLSPSGHGFTISAAGFSHKLPALALRVCSALSTTATSPCDTVLFDRAVQKLKLALQNAGHVAAERAHEARLQILERPHFTPTAQLDELARLTPTDVEAYISAELGLMQRAGGDLGGDLGGGGAVGGGDGGAVGCDGGGDSGACGLVLSAYVAGNLTEDEALCLYAQARSALRLPRDERQPHRSNAAEPVSTDKAPTPKATAPKVTAPKAAAPKEPRDAESDGAAYAEADRALDGCVLLPAGVARCYRVASTNQAETNCAIELYWQVRAAPRPDAPHPDAPHLDAPTPSRAVLVASRS